MNELVANVIGGLAGIALGIGVVFLFHWVNFLRWKREHEREFDKWMKEHGYR